MGSRTTYELKFQVLGTCSIVPLDFTYKTQMQRLKDGDYSTFKFEALLSMKLWVPEQVTHA